MKKYILTIFIVFAISANSFAGQDGNGGGVIKDGEQLKTMAEAGILLQRASNFASNLNYHDYFSLPEDTISEVVKLVSLLPLSPEKKSDLVSEIIGGRTTFVAGDEINQIEYKKIVSDYAKTLKIYNYQLDESLFTLAAITIETKNNIVGNTILFPSFSKLKALQQAFILIHERNFRYADKDSLKNKKQLLGTILELDTEIFKLWKANEQGISLDPMRTIAVLQDLRIATEDDVAYNAIKNLQMKTNNPILVEDFIIFEFVSPISIATDPSLIKRLNKYDPRVLQIFENTELRLQSSSETPLINSPIHETAQAAITRVCDTIYSQMKNSSKQIIYAQDYVLLAFSCDKKNVFNNGIIQITGAKSVY